MNPDFGLKIGTVVRPKPGGAGGAGGAGAKPKDPNCVTVRILDGINSTAQPTYKEVTARVLASFAGSTSSEKVSYGSVIIPQDGEQVLVGYLDGNSQGEAYILGSVFQGTVAPPYDITKTKAPSDTAAAGESMVIKLKNETQISINNVSSTVTSIAITTKNGRTMKFMEDEGNSLLQILDNEQSPQTYLKMDFKNGAIECKALKTMTLAAGGEVGSIVISDKGEITMKGQKINIEATTDASIKGAQMAIEGSSQTNIKGGQTTIEGQTKTDVKGGMVEVNGPSVKIGTMVQLG